MKFPRKHGVMMNFLSSMLRDEVINIAFITIMTIGGGHIDLALHPLSVSIVFTLFGYDVGVPRSLRTRHIQALSLIQGWHKLENYLILEGFLEKSLKIKILENHSKALKSL